MLDWEADCEALEDTTDVTECESGLGVDVERWVSAGVAEFICEAVSLGIDDDVALGEIVCDSDSDCVAVDVGVLDVLFGTTRVAVTDKVGVLDALCNRAVGDTDPLGENETL